MGSPAKPDPAADRSSPSRGRSSSAGSKVISRVLMLVGIFWLGLLGLVFISVWTIDTVKINGPYYEQLIRKKDLVGDIEPPPLFIVEANLIVHEMSLERDPSRLAALVDRSRQLRREFEASMLEWRTRLPATRLLDVLEGRVVPTAQRFFDLRDEHYVPALQQGDTKLAGEILARLESAYQAHRTAVDQVMLLAVDLGKQDEEATRRVVRRSTLVIVVVGLGLMSLGLGLGFLVLRSLSRPMRALEESEERFRRIFEHSAMGIALLGRGGSVLRCNPALERILGFSEAELQRSCIREFTFPSDRDRDASLLEALTAGKTNHYSLETRLIRKGGSVVWGKLTASLVKYGGEFLTIAVVEDVTAAVTAKETETALAHDLGERVKELVAMRAAAQVLQDDSLSEAEVLQRFAELLPPAFQFPEITKARVQFEGREFQTAGFTESRWRLTAPVKTSAGSGGAIEVFYASEKPQEAEGPFRAEERRLLESLSHLLEVGLDRRHSQRKMRALLENSAEGLAVLDRNGVILFEHVPADSPLGYKEGDQVGKNALDFVHPDDREYVMARLKECVEQPRTPIAQDPVRYRTRDGGWEWVEGTGINRLDDPAVGAIILNYRVVTERKRFEEALRASEDSYRGIVETAEEGIIVLDTHSRGQFANKKYFAMTGFTPQEFIGKSVLDLVMSEDVESARSHLSKRREGISDQYEIRLRRKDGSPIPVLVSASPMVDRDGAYTGSMALCTDMTSRKTLEAQFLQAQKMLAVGRLAGGIAHDFNNLLTVINGYSEILLAGMTPGSQTHADLQEVLNAGKRAAGLTRQLLIFSRKQVIQPVKLDLNTILSGLEKMLVRLLGEDIKLAFVPAKGLRRVVADPGQIEQAVVNLVVNARDAMPLGGRIAIETANVDPDDGNGPRSAGTPRGSYVMFSVTDTGTGMSPEVKAHLFEPFYTTKAEGKGTGLGLSTVQGIVKQSGGTIEVTSEVGRGTTFKVFLPQSDNGTEASAGLVSIVEGARGKETVLIAEDQESLRRLAQTILESSGYSVLLAKDGTEALKICEDHEGDIHLLLTDIVMRSMTGGELAKVVSRIRPETGILFMSGYTERGMDEQGLLGGQTSLLQKPFSSDDLKRKVREVLDLNKKRGTSKV